MSGRLEGKVAVITGGASGMGLATMERFMGDGASVVFCDLPPVTTEELVERFGPEKARLHHGRREKGGPNDGWVIADRLGDRATFVPADVSDGDALAEVVDTAVSRYGGLDVMYNNAGIGGAEGSLLDCPEAVYDRVLEVDLKAVWRGMRLAARPMIERGGGSIISTASVAGLTGFPGLAAYSAAKAGVIGLTRVAAIELAPHRIRVNAICPGGIVTPIIYDNPAFPQTLDPEALRTMMTQVQPLPRAGEPFDIAAAALWLASDDSSFVTGQAIAVDGGLTAEADSRSRNRPSMLS